MDASTRVPVDEYDRADELQEKIDDYLGFGIPYVWVVNPRTRRGFVYTADGMRGAKDGVLRAETRRSKSR